MEMEYKVKLAGDDLHKSGTRLKHGKDVSSSERTSSGKSLVILLLDYIFNHKDY